LPSHALTAKDEAVSPREMHCTKPPANTIRRAGHATRDRTPYDIVMSNPKPDHVAVTSKETRTQQIAA
jgi:hypothetical protein